MAIIVTHKIEPMIIFLRCCTVSFFSCPLINRKIKYKRNTVRITKIGLTLPASVGKTKIIINKESDVKPIKQY